MAERAAATDDKITLSRADAHVIQRLMTEFYLRDELSEDERRAYMALIDAGNFGRPVPPHGSGP